MYYLVLILGFASLGVDAQWCKEETGTFTSLDSYCSINQKIHLSGDLSITGSGASSSEIDLNSKYFQVDDLHLTLKNMTIKNGFSMGGGCIEIFNTNGKFTCENCVIKDCSTENDSDEKGEGGAIYSKGTVTLTNTIIQNNEAKYGWTQHYEYRDNFGGAIFVDGGSLTWNGGALKSNTAHGTGETFDYDSYSDAEYPGRGGGLYIKSGTVTMTDVDIESNKACAGGGIYAKYGTLTMTKCTFKTNTINTDSNWFRWGGAGMWVDGTTTNLRECLFDNNNDGEGSADGIKLDRSVSPTITLVNTAMTNQNNDVNSWGGLDSNSYQGSNGNDASKFDNYVLTCTSTGSRCSVEPFMGTCTDISLGVSCDYTSGYCSTKYKVPFAVPPPDVTCRDPVCVCSNGTPEVGAGCMSEGANMCSACDAGFHESMKICYQNQCTCAGGTAATGAACATHNNATCASCDPGKHLDGGECKDNICTCTGGDPVIGSQFGFVCPSTGTEYCLMCNFPYQMNAQNTCDPPPCQCPNGTPGTGCTQNMQTKCASCLSGYDLINDACVPKPCVCGNGTVATPCSTPGNQQCASCDSGYFEQPLGPGQSQCDPNVCSCIGGTEAIGASCPLANSQICASCDPGHTLDNNFCPLNQCTCANGKGTEGTACAVTGTPHCFSCDDFFRLDNQTCTANVCTCADGTPDTSCITHNTEQCASCDALFHLDNQTCAANVCTCSNGNVATCNTHDTEVCASCNALFHLENQTCAANVCTCANGNVGTCNTHNAEVCASCDALFHLENDECKANVCTCANGNVATCNTHNTETCASCDALFHLENGECKANVCTCANGNADTTCNTHNSEWCASCNAGFHGPLCDQNICSCTDGSPETGSSCTVHNSQQCASCDALFHLDNQVCVVNVCTCANGNADTSCNTHDSEQCVNCNGGFHGTLCEQNICNCPNGAVTDDCAIHNSESCKSCAKYYHNAGSDCLKNTCSCSNGEVAENCEADGKETCLSCDSGYFLIDLYCAKEEQSYVWIFILLALAIVGAIVGIVFVVIGQKRRPRQEYNTLTVDEPEPVLTAVKVNLYI